MPPYLIPKPITQKYELFPGTGWGVAEVGWLAAGIAAGFGWFSVSAWVQGSIPVRLIGAIICGLIGVTMALPVPSQEPLHQLLRAWWHYRQRPRLYLYDWTASDWEDVPKQN